MNVLTKEEIAERSPDLHERWEIADDKIVCALGFKDFIEAFSFMTKIALHAEKLNHHPNWQNVYNSITLELSTHDAGGITALDFDLAMIIDREYANY